MKSRYVIGVDEVGRGPLAGPVGVGVALVTEGFDWGLLPGVTDSKKLTAIKREEIYKTARKLKASGQLDFQVSLISAKQIDKIGIVPAINLATTRALKLLTKRAYSPVSRTIENEEDFGKQVLVKLDGGLKAPEWFVNQETIVKGDAKEQVIGLASVVAKVTRDRYMVRIATRSQFAPYNFQDHKGYGTKNHREAIAKNGLSTEHRASYCKNVVLL